MRVPSLAALVEIDSILAKGKNGYLGTYTRYLGHVPRCRRASQGKLSAAQDQIHRTSKSAKNQRLQPRHLV